MPSLSRFNFPMQRGMAMAGLYQENIQCVDIKKVKISPESMFQPKATSRVIITAKPIIAPVVAASECFSAWDSGINSSTTT